MGAVQVLLCGQPTVFRPAWRLLYMLQRKLSLHLRILSPVLVDYKYHFSFLRIISSKNFGRFICRFRRLGSFNSLYSHSAPTF